MSPDEQVRLHQSTSSRTAQPPARRRLERRLALMRPLSLAGIFAAICSLLVGVVNGLVALTRVDAGPGVVKFAALVLAEAMAPVFLAFAFLTVAWLCVALGMRKI